MKAFSILVPRNACFGVAVSGGSDSMALLVLAADYQRETGATCLAVTVDHGLRPEAADEARFVRKACRELGIEHAILKWRRTADGAVSQDDARRARHVLLAQWARRSGVARIALGHTQDDRLETFLMRARQGSGWHGLAGLAPSAFSPVWPEGRDLRIVRPLLAFSREGLRNEMRARGQSWVDDPSNEASRYERVRMRRLLARMTPAAKEKALGVMDQLLALRASVVGEALGLLDRVRHGEDGREAIIPLSARTTAGAEAWLRLVEALVMAAGGGQRPPRRDALERLLARIDSRDTQLAKGTTLAGAKIRIRPGDGLAFSRAPARRGAAAAGDADWARAAALLDVPALDALAV